MKTYTIKQAKELNKLLGYKGLESFSKLYPNGGSVNAFGYPSSSMHTIKHEFKSWFGETYVKDSGLIRFVSTHTTYFKPTQQTVKLNMWLEIEGAKTLSECIDYLRNNP